MSNTGKVITTIAAAVSIVSPVWYLVYKQGQESQLLSQVATAQKEIAKNVKDVTAIVTEIKVQEARLEERVSGLEREVYVNVRNTIRTNADSSGKESSY